MDLVRIPAQFILAGKGARMLVILQRVLDSS